MISEVCCPLHPPQTEPHALHPAVHTVKRPDSLLVHRCSTSQAAVPLPSCRPSMCSARAPALLGSSRAGLRRHRGPDGAGPGRRPGSQVTCAPGGNNSCRARWPAAEARQAVRQLREGPGPLAEQPPGGWAAGSQVPDAGRLWLHSPGTPACQTPAAWDCNHMLRQPCWSVTSARPASRSADTTNASSVLTQDSVLHATAQASRNAVPR